MGSSSYRELTRNAHLGTLVRLTFYVNHHLWSGVRSQSPDNGQSTRCPKWLSVLVEPHSLSWGISLSGVDVATNIPLIQILLWIIRDKICSNSKVRVQSARLKISEVILSSVLFSRSVRLWFSEGLPILPKVSTDHCALGTCLKLLNLVVCQDSWRQPLFSIAYNDRQRLKFLMWIRIADSVIVKCCSGQSQTALYHDDSVSFEARS